ncbi:hypothetical protein GCM10009592_24680 [Brachybacterium rhamnosum]|uniref:Cation-transporting ATPase n=1 Tax=Brachybacterium rhamnosum TaxID=173361 RepID=A0ABW4Q0T8_9MICO
MSTFDRLTGKLRRVLGASTPSAVPATRGGTDRAAAPAAPAGSVPATGAPTSAGASTGTWQSSFTAHSAALTEQDHEAIAQYERIVRVASPEQLEAVHREALERLTPLQRQEVEARLRAELPEAERPRSSRVGDIAGSLTAGAATLGGGGLLGAGGLLAAVAGGVVVSSAASSLLHGAVSPGHDLPGAPVGPPGGEDFWAQGDTDLLGDAGLLGGLLGGFDLEDLLGR